MDMKLSNKILIGFFATIFLYMTAVFAEVRLRGTPNIMNDTNSVAEVVDLTGISRLVLRGVDKQIDVVGSDRPRLEIRRLREVSPQPVGYTIAGDSLILTEAKAEDLKLVRITIYVSMRDLKQISVDRSGITVKGFRLDTLQVVQRSGRVWMSDSSIGNIELDASDKSHFEIYGDALPALSAKVNDSEVILGVPVGSLTGEIKNNSLLRLTDIKNIEVNKDESSRMSLYQ